ncbi:MAG: M48 family metalloprotease [Alphaproteobacteria bacterium]|nr:M48 family metalloprotease [Alphaproteobacteria bacterium]
MIKQFRLKFLLIVTIPFLASCTTNPATGQKQFTALMSPTQENQIGAQEHQKVIKQFGLYNDPALQSYVSQVGQKVVAHTERKDVQYKFFVVDSPVVNAFALPGGYIYMSRGLLALANNEAEMAAVLAHEAGHITARHSAERYSRGVVTGLGASILSAAIGVDEQVFGLGAELYLKSYSRGQESQSDSLGIRYLSRAGFHPYGMTGFLKNLDADTALENKIDGKGGDPAASYLSTHPVTAQRITATMQENSAYPQQGVINREGFLNKIQGMVYGDSPHQGFAKGNNFYHPDMGFTFSVPQGFRLINQPEQVVSVGPRKDVVIIFDMSKNEKGVSPSLYMRDVWMKNRDVHNIEAITINGMRAASGSVLGQINGQEVSIQLIAIQWSPQDFVRFQVAMPKNLSGDLLEDLKRTTYSFRRLSAPEKQSLKPYKIKLVRAGSGDSVSSLASKMAVKEYAQDRFRVLNGLAPAENVQSGALYKIIME